MSRLRDAGLLVYLRDATSTAGVATLDCSTVELQADGRHLAHGGSGTHPDARVAATRPSPRRPRAESVTSRAAGRT